MRKIVSLIKDNWKDPVWSKVIASVIITITGTVLGLIWVCIKFLLSDMSFAKVFSLAISRLKGLVSIPIWLLILLIAIYLILVFKPAIYLIKELSVRKNRLKLKEEDVLPNASEDSEVFFYYRVASAFPGVRGLKWFDNPKDIIHRLSIVLKKPIRFNPEGPYLSDPIWWFRGHRALFINEFKRLKSNKVLLNIDELKIKRIAVNYDQSYYKCFIYVETYKEKQTGLYNYSDEDIKRHIKTFGYSSEEYGLVNSLFKQKPITREEYDDGATIIRGKVKEVSAELRVRYLSDYNFIIAAKGSPYNSMKFDRHSQDYLDKILRNEIEPEVFFDFLNTFNKYE